MGREIYNCFESGRLGNEACKFKPIIIVGPKRHHDDVCASEGGSPIDLQPEKEALADSLPGRDLANAS